MICLRSTGSRRWLSEDRDDASRFFRQARDRQEFLGESSGRGVRGFGDCDVPRQNCCMYSPEIRPLMVAQICSGRMLNSRLREFETLAQAIRNWVGHLHQL